MSVLTAQVVPGYLPPDGQLVTPAELRLVATPTVNIVGTVNAASIADGSITNAKLAANSVSTVDVIDAAITGGKIASATITQTNVANAAIGTAQLIDLSVSSGKLGTDLAGFLLPYAGTGTPTGWLSCDGQAVSRTTYAALFTNIGTTWGTGDGSTTFNLPNLNGRTLIHAGTGTVPLTFTADHTSGNLTVSSQSSIYTGAVVRVSNSGGALPSGLSAGTDYYAVRISDTVLQLAATRAAAFAADAAGGAYSTTFTASSSTSQLTVASQSTLYTGALVQVSNSGGGLPTGLSSATNYYVIRISATLLQLATTLANAQAGTPITLSSNGTGTQTVTLVTAVAMADNGSGTNTVTLTLTARTLGQVMGEETHAISGAEVGPHVHPFSVVATNSDASSSGAITGGSSNTANDGIYSAATALASSGNPHNNMQPTAVVRYLIKT